MLQYGTPSDWAVAAITNDKKGFIANRKKWGIPDEWGKDLSLHHQISKANLTKLGTEVIAIRDDKKADPALKKAAQSFWDAVQEVVPVEIKKQANSNFITLLWNMPLNLEIGPELVSNNPGIGFDPNTEPNQDGSRKLTGVSAQLQRLEQTYLKAVRDGKLTEVHLNNMAGNLRQAYKIFVPLTEKTGTFLAPPYSEQWIFDPQASADSPDKFQRKGLKIFMGAKEGKFLFEKASTLGASSATIPQSAAAITTIQVPYTLTWKNKQILINIDVVFPESTLHHVCVRHTYAYFDFSQAKVVNSFWPNPTMSSSDVKDWITKALPFIGATGGDYIQSKISEGDEPAEIDTLLTGQNIRIGDSDEMLYFIASIGIEDIASDGETPESFTMTVKTATQDANAHAYTGKELQTIK